MTAQHRCVPQLGGMATQVPDGSTPDAGTPRKLGYAGQTAVLSRTCRLIRLSIATIPLSRSGETASASPNR